MHRDIDAVVATDDKVHRLVLVIGRLDQLDEDLREVVHRHLQHGGRVLVNKNCYELN